MGIKRLTQFLKKDFILKNISEYANLNVAVDISSWIYQAYFSQLEYTGDNSLLVIRNIEMKLKIILKENISAIFVFDGHDLNCKRLTQEKRNKKRNYYFEKAKKENAKKSQSSENHEKDEKKGMYKRYSEPIPDELFYDVLDFLKFRSQNVMVAPYESDSQLAYLYLNGKVDFIISEDSDMFAYGCEKIIKGLKFNGECKVINLKNFRSNTEEIRDLINLGHLIRP